MSAAAAAPLTETGKKIHACLLPRSYFLLNLPKTARVCLGLILEQTKGFGRKSAHILRSRFQSVAGVGSDEITEALRLLKERGLIRVIEREGKGGKRRDEYEAILETAPEHTAIGECEECGKAGVVYLAKGQVPTPHAYLTELPSCVRDSVYVVVGLILAKTCAWSEQSGSWRFAVHAEEIASADLEWEASLDHTALFKALKEAGELGLIEASGRSGKIRTYKVCVDPLGNFKKLPKRQARVVSISYNRGKRKLDEPKPGETITNPQPVTPAQVVGIPAKTTPPETVLRKLAALCGNCGIFSLKRIIAMPAPDSSIPESTPSYARAGPGPPKAAKFNPKMEIPPDLREIYACVARWSRGFSVAPSVDLARAVSTALQGGPVALLDRRYTVRREAIRNARMPGILVSIAQDAGEFWLVSQQFGFDPLKYEEPELPRRTVQSTADIDRSINELLGKGKA